MARDKEIKKRAKAQYAGMASQGHSSCPMSRSLAERVERAVSLGYTEQELASVPAEAVMGMGCGNPAAFAKLREGETVLDLGCGGGLDAFLASRKVGGKGKVIGVDMTPEMIEKARKNAAKGRYRNVEFKLAEIEKLPVADESVDVIISNCVINHSPDKLGAFREACRALKHNGRMLISDLVISGNIPGEDLRGLDEAWAAWFAAEPLAEREYLDTINRAGFRAVAVAARQPFDCPGMDDKLKGKLVSVQVDAHK